jgi:hypothetical protein
LSGSEGGVIQLNWTAPGDDGDTGRAVGYLVRRARAEITSEGDWAAATIVSGAPAPQAAGASESMAVTALDPGEWWFAVRAQDDAVNLGSLSNAASASAGDGPDLTAPDPPSGLAASELGENGLELTWAGSSESDLAGYNVYRRGAADGTGPRDWSKLNVILLDVARFLDDSVRPKKVYEYAVTAQDLSGNESGLSNAVEFSSSDLGESLLDSNQPNPFRHDEGTEISFRSPETPGDSVPTALRVYDVTGRQVRLLYHGGVSAGETRTVRWDGRNDDGKEVAPGVYFYRLQVGSQSSLPRRMVILR